MSMESLDSYITGNWGHDHPINSTDDLDEIGGVCPVCQEWVPEDEGDVLGEEIYHPECLSIKGLSLD